MHYTHSAITDKRERDFIKVGFGLVNDRFYDQFYFFFVAGLERQIFLAIRDEYIHLKDYNDGVFKRTG
jgi:hypothetical protein